MFFSQAAVDFVLKENFAMKAFFRRGSKTRDAKMYSSTLKLFDWKDFGVGAANKTNGGSGFAELFLKNLQKNNNFREESLEVQPYWTTQYFCTID